MPTFEQETNRRLRRVERNMGIMGKRISALNTLVANLPVDIDLVSNGVDKLRKDVHETLEAMTQVVLRLSSETEELRGAILPQLKQQTIDPTPMPRDEFVRAQVRVMANRFCVDIPETHDMSFMVAKRWLQNLHILEACLTAAKGEWKKGVVVKHKNTGVRAVIIGFKCYTPAPGFKPTNPNTAGMFAVRYYLSDSLVREATIDQFEV